MTMKTLVTIREMR